jgi:serralysin
MRRAFLCLAMIACAVAFGASSALAAPADLDRSFGGGDGIAEVTGPAGSLPGEAAGRMAIGPNDEIFVLYSNYPPCDPPFDCRLELAVVRYTPNGSPDPTFATEPQIVFNHSSPYNRNFEIAVGPDGKPVVAAYGGEGLVLARLGLDGRLDPSFGVGGVIPFTSNHSVEVANDFPKLAVQPDGKIVVAVQSGREESGRNLAVARFLANGEYDPSFGSGGELDVLVGTQTRPAGLFLGTNGSVTVPVPLCCLGGTGLFGEGISVVRLTAAGQLDPGWAGDGTLFMPTPGTESAVEAAAPAGDGLLLSVESSTPLVSTVGNLIKLAPSGALDPSFGNGGGLRLFNRVGAVDPKDLALDAKGRIVGVGWSSRIGVFRLRSDGSRDRTFNGGEHLVVPYGGGGTPHYMVGIQSNGRIIAFGDSGLGAAKRFGLIALRGGTDRTRCLGKKATIVGTRGRDELAGTPRRDVIAALAGKDVVRGFAGKDLICGGKGRDQLFGGPGRDLTDEDPRRRKGRGGKPVR